MCKIRVDKFIFDNMVRGDIIIFLNKYDKIILLHRHRFFKKHYANGWYILLYFIVWQGLTLPLLAVFVILIIFNL